jgi:hypothetical protein
VLAVSAASDLTRPPAVAPGENTPEINEIPVNQFVSN